jgi:hypothetical protein
MPLVTDIHKVEFFSAFSKIIFLINIEQGHTKRMITTEWKDFVFSGDAPIRTIQDRFNVNRGGRIAQLSLFEQFGDKFEAMDVSDLGDVTIWTTTKVWCIRKETGLENLIYLPRNPPY